MQFQKSMIVFLGAVLTLGMVASAISNFKYPCGIEDRNFGMCGTKDEKAQTWTRKDFFQTFLSTSMRGSAD
jgi:hypothetical protein